MTLDMAAMALATWTGTTRMAAEVLVFLLLLPCFRAQGRIIQKYMLLNYFTSCKASQGPSGPPRMQCSGSHNMTKGHWDSVILRVHFLIAVDTTKYGLQILLSAVL